MTLREDIAADAPDAWFDTGDLAQTVIYGIPATQFVEAQELAIPALISYGGNLEDKGRYQAEEMTAIVRQADVAAPKTGDTITIGETVWTVLKSPRSDGLGLAWELACTKGARPRLQRG